MYGYIYKTTDLTNGKIYVGKRKSDKFLGIAYVGSGDIIRRIVAKCKKENILIRDRFSVVLIDSAETNEELNAKEVYWIEQLQSRDPSVGYNLRRGGDCGRGGPMFAGHTHSIKTKEHMSIMRKGEKNSNFGKHRIMPLAERGKHACFGDKNGMYGKHHTEESINKNKESHKGRKKLTNDDIYPKFRYIKANDIEVYLSHGWYFYKNK